MTDIQDTTPDVAAVKASTLIESLPWLKKFRDQIVVIKYGGNAMISDELQEAFAQDIAYLRYVGVQPVVVHGGGPQISDMLERLDIPSEFKGGYRVTNTEAISVVRMVLTGQVNPQLVAKINSHGPIATGLSGEDAGLFGGRRRGVVIDGEEIDLGRVGDVVEVDPDAGARSSRRRSHPGGVQHRSRPRSSRSVAERECGCRGRRARGRTGRRQARHPHRRAGALRGLAESRLARLASHLDRAHRHAAGAASRG